MDRVRELGCICCLLTWDIESPAEIHHTDGKTKPGCHFKVLPLCDRHHRNGGPGYVSRADGKKAFEAAYGTEQELLLIVDQRLEDHE